MIRKSRQYYIDWLRIVLIFSVFLFHIGMYFNTWDWHVKNDQTLPFLNYIMWFLHLWRMPLLFLVSGVGTYYALGHRKVKQYLKERFNRLFIPLVFGILSLVPIQVYIEKISEYKSLSHFYIHMFDGIYPEGNFSWHHLWFIVYLFIISVLISPFLNFLRSQKTAERKQNMISHLIRPLGLNWILVILITSQAILRQYFPDQTNALFNDWAYFVYYLLYFLAGFIFITDSRIVAAITQQRRNYLFQSILATVFLFSISSLFKNEALTDWLYGITGIVIGWSCGLTALGYFKQYFNKDNVWRKELNQAIYPFYLVHQPVIIVFGYYLKNLSIPIVGKIFLLTFLSFIVSMTIYWLFIKRFNSTRLLFGMKLRKNNCRTKSSYVPYAQSAT